MINEAQYRYFQTQLDSNKLFRYFWQFWSNYSFVFFVITGLILVTRFEFRAVVWEVIILSAISFLIARGIVVAIINLAYKRKRPYQTYNFAPITSRLFSFKTVIPNSFPSRHTAAYFSVVSVVSLFVPALGAVLFGAGLMTGAGRVVLGYHWPSDIFVGMVIGLVVGYLVVILGYPAIFT